MSNKNAVLKAIDWRLVAGVLASVSAIAWLSVVTASNNDTPSLREMQLQDIAAVREQYMTREMAYAPATRALAELQLEKLEGQAGHLSVAEFQAGLAIAGALTDNAHSGLRIPRSARNAIPRLPVRLLWFPDGLIVARATGEAKDLAGARVIRIEGRSPEALYEGAKVLLGGNDAFRKADLPHWLEREGILHALGLAESPNKVSMQLQLPNGALVQRRLKMLPNDDATPTAEFERLWLPQPVAGEDGWATAINNHDLPVYLRDAGQPFRAVSLPDMNALYIQFRSNEDEDGFSIADFLAHVNARIIEEKPHDLVVDFRFNVGGNITLTMDFMRALPASVSGRTYLLVGPYTFSAGIVSAAAIKKHGDGHRSGSVTVIGDGVGDRMHFWSEGTFIELPHSGYLFRYSDGQFNLRHGCTGEPGCMDDLYHIDVNQVSLVPDVHAPVNAADYLERRDPAMDAVRQLAKGGEK